MNYTPFRPEMKKTHTVLIPQMATVQFELLTEALKADGFDARLLKNTGKRIEELGQRYVHNDACYPATLVIGQFLDALENGGCDPEKTALAITQTGGGCRASNYLAMLRKALDRAGYSHIPVASVNFIGLEPGSRLNVSLKGLKNMIYGVIFGDVIMLLRNQSAPFEAVPGTSAALADELSSRYARTISRRGGMRLKDLKNMVMEAAKAFAGVEKTAREAVRVGIVGEIYVKYSPVGNGDLEGYLASQGCEVEVPGLFGFLQYCLTGTPVEASLYGGDTVKRALYRLALWVTEKLEENVGSLIRSVSSFRVPTPFPKLIEYARDFIGLGANMGEGWLLTAEMVDLVRSGCVNIVCAQPFGCLPNHVSGKAMIKKIRDAMPQANIMPIDYDPSASRVNQENRIKLMLSGASRQEAAFDDAAL